jgi:serralysin
MNQKPLYYCRECRRSHFRKIKSLKNAFLERSSNIRGASANEKLVLEDYAFKNVIKKPEHHITLARMALSKDDKWKNGRVLTVSFLGGDRQVIQRIIRHAKSWMEHANISFDFRQRKKPADVRISFNMKDGSWSYVGTDILSYSKDEPTMNFGWLSPTLNDIEFRQVVLHEFGHTLGCIHEHERPDNGIPWDKPKVYAYYKENDDWSKEEVDSQVFEVYDSSMIRASKLDAKSIMMYAVPNELTKGDFEIPWNGNLSASDKRFIAKMYPIK